MDVSWPKLNNRINSIYKHADTNDRDFDKSFYESLKLDN